MGGRAFALLSLAVWLTSYQEVRGNYIETIRGLWYKIEKEDQ